MTVGQVGAFVRRWLWLLVLGGVLAAVASYVVSQQLPKVYEGTAKLLVTPGQGAGTGAASYNDVLTAERLTRTYSEVLKSRPVVEQALREAGVAQPYEQALPSLQAQPVRDTQLIQVSARAGNPDRAADLANALVRAFIQQTQQSQSGRFAASKDSLARQVDQLAQDIQQRTGLVDQLRQQPSSTTREADLVRAQSDLASLQQSYAAAVRSYEDLRVAEARSNDLLAVVEPAAPVPQPVAPRVLVNVVLAGAVGLLLALAGAGLVEYLDDRLLGPERLLRFTGLHPLGAVSLLPKDGPRTLDQLPGQQRGGYGYGSYGSNTGEAYRVLGANLQFAAVERPLRTLLVTSADAGDGKTTTAANLAVVAAQAGQRVVLIDADLRRPTQHEVFGLSNRVGLTSLLVDPGLPLEAAWQPTRVPGLQVVPSGPLPPNPSELLASQRMRQRLLELQQVADLVVLDSPPVRPVSDPVVLAGVTDGVVLVVDAQKTRGQHASQAVAALKGAGARLLGAVLNRAGGARGGYYGYYGSYGRYTPRDSADGHDDRDGLEGTEAPPAPTGAGTAV